MGELGILVLGILVLGQDSCDRTTGTGQPERTVGIISQDRIEKKGWPP
jgi:hypothetical protein